MQEKNSICILLVTVCILLVPLLTMQFTDLPVRGSTQTGEVDWDLADFVVMGVLLFSAGLVIDFVTRKSTSSVRRVTAIIAIMIVFLLIWAELGVGIFGTPWAGS